MTPAALRKIREAVVQIRKSPAGRTARELQGLAKKLGRDKATRGKEPCWVRQRDPALSPPMSIPDHSGEMPIGTCRSIANALLDDCDEWEQYLMNEGDQT